MEGSKGEGDCWRWICCWSISLQTPDPTQSCRAVAASPPSPPQKRDRIAQMQNEEKALGKEAAAEARDAQKKHVTVGAACLRSLLPCAGTCRTTASAVAGTPQRRAPHLSHRPAAPTLPAGRAPGEADPEG